MDKKENREKSGRRDWYKLDLSAIVYPTLQRRDFSSVYRLSVVLKEEIKPDVLQKALDMTLPRFPTYKAAIRKGLFWRYLEPNDRPGPFVQEDVRIHVSPCILRRTTDIWCGFIIFETALPWRPITVWEMVRGACACYRH